MFNDVAGHRRLSNHTISLAMHCVGHRNSHVGILYNYAGRTYFLHFAGHRQLERNDLSSESYPYGTLATVEIEHYVEHDPYYHDRLAHIAFLETVYEENVDKIPYATKYEGAYFDSEKCLKLIGSEAGLTCASFVMAIFHSFHLEILNENSWIPRADDDEWRRFVASQISDCEQKRLILNEQYSVRFRPEEVFVAAINSNLFSNYSFCCPNGAVIKQKLSDNQPITDSFELLKIEAH